MRVDNPPCYSIATHTILLTEREHMMLLENRSSSTEYEDASHLDTESRELGRQRLYQLERWILEDKLANDTLCVRSYRLWLHDVVTRLSTQSHKPLKFPHRLKLPLCLMHVRGLTSSAVILNADGSVKTLVYANNVQMEGMELIPAKN